MLGWSVDEAFGMSLVETGQHPLAVCNDLLCSTIVHILRSEQGESRMMMLAVVPLEKAAAKLPGVLTRAKATGEVRPIFESFELALREGIVVGNVRAAVSFCHSQVGQKQGQGFSLHRRASVRMERELTRCNALFVQTLLE